MWAIVGKALVYGVMALYGVAMAGLFVEDLRTNNLRKPVMVGCHFEVNYLVDVFGDPQRTEGGMLCYHPHGELRELP
jgi:hypothetical protein